MLSYFDISGIYGT